MNKSLTMLYSNLKPDPYHPEEQSFFINECYIEINILENSKDRFITLVKQLFDPNIIFDKNYYYNLSYFRRLALKSGVNFGIDSPIVSLEKMGLFLLRRDSMLGGKEISISFLLTGFDNIKNEEMKEALDSFFNYLNNGSTLADNSYFKVCSKSGSGRQKEVFFANNGPKYKYLIVSDLDYSKEAMGEPGESSLFTLFHHDTKEIYTLEELKSL